MLRKFFIYKDLRALPTPNLWNNLKGKDTKLKTLPDNIKVCYHMQSADEAAYIAN